MVEASGPDPLAKAMGDEIEFWRRKRGLTREQLGALLGKSKNTIGRYERGETMPDVTDTWALADALGVALSQVIARVEDVIEADSPTDSDELAQRRSRSRVTDAAGNVLPSREDLDNVAGTRKKKEEDAEPRPEGSE